MKTLKIYMAVVLCSTMFFACNRAVVGERNVVDNAKPTEAKFTSKTELKSARPMADFNNWDADSSGGITHKEFNAGIMNENLFFDWDTDNSGYLSSMEYSMGVFGQWDKNDNKKIDSNEWMTRSSVWDNPKQSGVAVNSWAPTIDKPLACKPFCDAYAQCSNYMPWDTDLNGMLDINEFNDGTFISLDRNHNGLVDAIEFNAFTGGMYMNTSPRNAGK